MICIPPAFGPLCKGGLSSTTCTVSVLNIKWSIFLQSQCVRTLKCKTEAIYCKIQPIRFGFITEWKNSELNGMWDKVGQKASHYLQMKKWILGIKQWLRASVGPLGNMKEKVAFVVFYLKGTVIRVQMLANDCCLLKRNSYYQFTRTPREVNMQMCSHASLISRMWSNPSAAKWKKLITISCVFTFR